MSVKFLYYCRLRNSFKVCDFRKTANVKKKYSVLVFFPNNKNTEYKIKIKSNKYSPEQFASE